jgi:glycosyltransferase involved in cell wall biosynthesis
MKKPIIISDHIAAANYIIFDKKTGLLFKDNDPIDLALKIKYLIDHKESASTLGLEACNFVKEHFSSTAMIDRIKNVYVEIFNRK